MMRLPPFKHLRPKSAAEIATMLRDEGPDAAIVAGGTDLYPNMKRRHQTPKTLISVRGVDELRGVSWLDDGTLRIGPGERLRMLERMPSVAERLPALHEAISVISSPILRNMGTIGGNLCLDTRCNYLNQNWEWRRSIDFCKKCDGETCWVAPSSPVCWAVNSSDAVPVMIATGARVRLVSAGGEREISCEDLSRGEDGRDWMAKRQDEVMTDIFVPPQGEARATYRKLRRRGSFDFPVLGVAARIEGNGVVERADIILNAIAPFPVRCENSQAALVGKPLRPDTIAEAADLAIKDAKPLDNTDFAMAWRRKMVPVFVRRALTALMR